MATIIEMGIWNNFGAEQDLGEENWLYENLYILIVFSMIAGYWTVSWLS